MKFTFTQNERNAMETTLKFHFLPTRLAKQQKLENWQGFGKSGNHVFCVMGMKIDTIALERYLAKSNKTMSYKQLPGMHLDDTTPTVQKFICTRLFSKTLFVTAKYWKSLIGDWVNILWYIHTI